MNQKTSLIVNESRLPATIKRLFKNSIAEICHELLQNSQRAGATRIDFEVDRKKRQITISDDGSGIPSSRKAWARVLRMADSAYQNPAVESDQKPMGLGLLSLFALENVFEIKMTSGGLTVTIDTDKLWNTPDYWSSWTDLITETARVKEGFEIVASYHGPPDPAAFDQTAYQFEAALGLTASFGALSEAAPRGYEGLLDVFLNNRRMETSIPEEYVPSGKNLLFDTVFDGNRLRIGMGVTNFYHEKGVVVWYGQIIKIPSSVPFLLEVTTGNPVTPLAPTRSGLVNDAKLGKLQNFIQNQIFKFLVDEEFALGLSPSFIKRIYQEYPLRAHRELSVCVLRKITLEANTRISNFDDFYSLGEETVMSYRQIEEQNIFICSERAMFYLGQEEDQSEFKLNFTNTRNSKGFAGEERDANPEWGQASYGLACFVSVLGGEIYTLEAGNRQALPLKTIFWKPGAHINEFFYESGTFAIGQAGKMPEERDFKPVREQVFVFELTGNWDVSSVAGLCVGIPVGGDRQFAAQAAWWLEFYGKACYCPDDDYDYEQQENDFEYSINRMLLELKGDTISTNWKFDELKGVIERILEQSGETDAVRIGQGAPAPQFQITSIGFEQDEGNTKLNVRLQEGRIIKLNVAPLTYLN